MSDGSVLDSCGSWGVDPPPALEAQDRGDRFFAAMSGIVAGATVIA